MLAYQASQYHYHFPSYGVSQAPQFSSLSESRNRILNIFLTRFAAYNRLPKTDANTEKIIQLLNDFSSGGTIGSKITQELENLNFATDNEGRQISDLATSANFNTVMEELEVRIPDEAKVILESVNVMLNSMIEVLSNAGQDLAVYQLKMLKHGASVNEVWEKTGVKVQDGFYSETQISLADVANRGTFETLFSVIDQLQGNVPQDLTLSEIKGKIAGCFNDIGGVMLEPVTAHAINIVGNRIRDLDREVNSLFQSSANRIGGTFHAEPVGQNAKENGAQQKNDIELKYYKDGILYRFGGSIKLRQEKKDNIFGTGRIENLHSGLTLGALIEATLADNGQSHLGQYYAAVLGAYKSTASNRSRIMRSGVSAYDAALDSWEQMRTAALMSGMLLALSGSGKAGDFAGIFVFNSRIYSVYEMLLNSIYTQKNGGEKAGVTITPKTALTRGEFDSVNKTIKDFVRQNNRGMNGKNRGTKIGARQKETANMINALYSTKVQINISFATLFQAGLTRF